MYQGRWNAAYRDMESEIIPMCEDQGMAIISWASLGGGQLATDAQRQQANEDQNAGKGFYNASENDIAVSRVLEKLAEKKGVTLQQVVTSLPSRSLSRAAHCCTCLMLMLMST